MKVNCPQCNDQVEWVEQASYRPFCSKRCQLIDLGEWANEEKRITTADKHDTEKASTISIDDIDAMLAEQPDDFFKE